MKTIEICTHNGIFHSDEVLAIALLRVFKKNVFSIKRTRDAAMIAASDIAVDVGGIHDGESRFDHHQFTSDDKLHGLSSAGLVLATLTLPEFSLVRELVKIVDAHDTGKRASHSHPFIKAVSGMNSPSDINGDTQDKNFYAAVEYATAVIERLQNPLEWDTVESVSSNLMGGWADLCPACGCPAMGSRWELLYNNNSREKETLEKKIQEAVASVDPLNINGVQVIVLHKRDPFIPVKRLIGLADLSVSWDDGQDCWTVQTIPLVEGEFGSRVLLTPTGEEDEVFCHKAGFIGKYKECDNSIVFSINGDKKEVMVG